MPIEVPTRPNYRVFVLRGDLSLPKLQDINYVKKNASSHVDALLSNPMETEAVITAAAKNGAVNGDILVYHPVSSNGLMITGRNFRPHVIAFEGLCK